MILINLSPMQNAFLNVEKNMCKMSSYIQWDFKPVYEHRSVFYHCKLYFVSVEFFLYQSHVYIYKYILFMACNYIILYIICNNAPCMTSLTYLKSS